MIDIVEELRSGHRIGMHNRLWKAADEIEKLRYSLMGTKALHESAVTAWIEAAKQRDALVKALRDVMDASNDPYEVAKIALGRVTPAKNTGCGALFCEDPNCTYGKGKPRCQKCGDPITQGIYCGDCGTVTPANRAEP